MSGTEIITSTVNASPIALARVCRPAAPVTGIAALIAETLADLSYDETRAICYQETIERACAGDRLSQRYMMIADPSGDDATGRMPDLTDREIWEAVEGWDLMFGEIASKIDAL